MQHRRDADLCAKMLGIGGDRRRQREDNMEVADRQQLGFPVGKPVAGSRSLTLRAVPVATAIVGDMGVAACAVLAPRNVTTSRRSAPPARRATVRQRSIALITFI